MALGSGASALVGTVGTLAGVVAGIVDPLAGAVDGVLGPVVGVWDPGPYRLVRFWFRRALALVYLLAFLVAAFQFRALAGENGLLPLDRYLERRDFREAPTLFQFWPTDRAIGVAAWSGVALSVLALSGATDRFGLVVSVVSWTALWVLYQSLVNAGQVFYGYGWESMLLETGFLAIFLGPMGVAAPAVVVFLLRWVQFRNMFGAGLIKLRGDDCWRDLTCMDHHYETQPMPNPLSWVGHHLPKPLHRVSVAVNHVVELAVPFFYFAPQPVAGVAGLVTIGFQGWLMLTGNFAFLNFLTIVLAVPLLSAPMLSVLPVSLSPGAPVPLALWVAVAGLTALVVALSYYPARNLISSGQRMNASFDPLHLVNTYGAFGSITKERREVVVEGTHDRTIDGDTEWEAYEFKGKPTDPERLPPQVAPYHLRLDWQLWFAAMSTPRHNPWFVHLVAKLLAGDERTLRLLHDSPFPPDDPPTHVRAVLYRYEFTDPGERSESGRWWRRTRLGTYLDPVSLSDPGFQFSLESRGWEVPDPPDRTGDAPDRPRDPGDDPPDATGPPEPPGS